MIAASVRGAGHGHGHSAEKGKWIMATAIADSGDDLYCGYCALPVVHAEGPRPGYRHGEGVPQVGPVTPGDYATHGHKPGLAVGVFDIVTRADLERGV